MSATGLADVRIVMPIRVIRSAALPAATRLVQRLEERLESHEECVDFPGNHVGKNLFEGGRGLTLHILVHRASGRCRLDEDGTPVRRVVTPLQKPSGDQFVDGPGGERAGEVEQVGQVGHPKAPTVHQR
ncbi:MAG: hypothetical protein Q8S43_11095 [Actinomycetota bacterium]|nr:hypothetical protein [Actinomycetota bacterium]MDZ4233576.1 hypothetical protein [Dietzia sp.]